MNESWMDDTPMGNWYKRSYPNRVMFAAALLRFAGWLGAVYCAALIAFLVLSWFALRFGADGVYPPFGPRITDYGLRLVVFLFTYAAGVVLPVLIRPEHPVADKPEQP